MEDSDAVRTVGDSDSSSEDLKPDSNQSNSSAKGRQPAQARAPSLAQDSEIEDGDSSSSSEEVQPDSHQSSSRKRTREESGIDWNAPLPDALVGSSPFDTHNDNRGSNDGIGDFNLGPRPFQLYADFELPDPPQHDQHQPQGPPQEEPDSSTKIERGRAHHFEITDMVSSLEHILMVGNHNRHQQWRLWKQQKVDEEAAAAAAADEEEDEEEKKKRPQFLHAEDIRVYGLFDGFPADPWPLEYQGRQKRYKVRSDWDKPWNKEHGDDIDNLEFSETRLSQVVPSTLEDHDDNKSDNDGKKHPFAHSKDIEDLLDPVRMNQLDPARMKWTPNPKQVPRSLLLRCWQRAMNAASFSTLQKPPDDPPPQQYTAAATATLMDELYPPDSPFLQPKSELPAKDLTELLYPPKAEDRNTCGVDLYPWATPTQPPFPCRICGNDFPTLQQAKAHFHGTPTVRGCAASRVEAQQRKMLAQALEKETVAQAETLIRYVVHQVRDKIEAEDNKKDTEKSSPPKLFSWKDILEILNNALTTSQECQMPPLQESNTAAVPEVAKTLQLEGGKAPALVINHHVLQAASSRLRDRYASVPR